MGEERGCKSENEGNTSEDVLSMSMSKPGFCTGEMHIDVIASMAFAWYLYLKTKAYMMYYHHLNKII